MENKLEENWKSQMHLRIQYIIKVTLQRNTINTIYPVTCWDTQMLLCSPFASLYHLLHEATKRILYKWKWVRWLHIILHGFPSHSDELTVNLKFPANFWLIQRLPPVDHKSSQPSTLSTLLLQGPLSNIASMLSNNHHQALVHAVSANWNLLFPDIHITYFVHSGLHFNIPVKESLSKDFIENWNSPIQKYISIVLNFPCHVLFFSTLTYHHMTYRMCLCCIYSLYPHYSLEYKLHQCRISHIPST